MKGHVQPILCLCNTNKKLGFVTFMTYELFRKKYPLDLKSLKQVHIKLQMNVMKDWQGIQTGCGDFLQQLKKHQSRK